MARRQVVEDAYLVALSEQTFDDVGADEARPTRYKDLQRTQPFPAPRR